MRRVAVLVLVGWLLLPSASASADTGPWVWPLAGERSVSRGFSPPTTAYGAGHRGVDLPSVPGAAVRAAGAGRVVVAVPVGAPESCVALAEVADEVVCLTQPPEFRAVGAWYDDFDQTTDDEVRALLAAAGAR